MRYDYVVILKKNSERATDLLSILLCVFSIFSFLYIAINGIRTDHFSGPAGKGSSVGAPVESWFIGILALVLAARLLYIIRSKRKSRYVRIRFRFLLLFAALVWMGLTPAPWMGLFFVLAAFLEYQTKRPLEIGFHHDRVVVNTLIKQRYDWTAFNNVILRDGLLTLDFKNNRLMQKEVADDDEEDDADEEEFNAWCQSQLRAADKVNVL